MSDLISTELVPDSNTEVTEVDASQGLPKKRRWQIINDSDTFIWKRSHVFAALLPVAFVLGLGAGFLIWGTKLPVEKAVVATQADDPQAQPEQAAQRYNVPEDGDPAYGREDAPITIIEFSDFECPYCRQWFKQVYLNLREDYPNQVRIVFRDFPLTSIHPNALPAAEAAECANEQGAFWEFHDRIFDGDKYGAAVYLEYADKIGLDMDKYKDCLDSGRYKSEVMGDYEYASQLGVRSTPTFFLNGLPIVGAQPYEVFKQVIEKELAGEIP